MSCSSQGQVQQAHTHAATHGYSERIMCSAVHCVSSSADQMCLSVMWWPDTLHEHSPLNLLLHRVQLHPQ